MADTPTPDNAPLAINSDGSDFTPQEYDLTPDEAQIVADIPGSDPLKTAPSPVQFHGGSIREPERFSASIFSNEKAATIRAQLAGVPADQREAKEHELVKTALEENSRQLRIKMGAGAGATAYEREYLQLHSDHADLDREAQEITLQLAEVGRSEVVYDEATGEQKVVLHDKITGDRRKAMEARLELVIRNAEQLRGVEGARRMAAALKETAANRLAVQRQLEEEAEAKVVGERMLREQRIAERAETYAKHRRHTIK